MGFETESEFPQRELPIGFEGFHFQSDLYLSPAMDVYSRAINKRDKSEVVRVLQIAQKELALLAERDIYTESFEWFKNEYGHAPEDLSPHFFNHFKDKFPKLEDTAGDLAISARRVAHHMASLLKGPSDPRRDPKRFAALRAASDTVFTKYTEDQAQKPFDHRTTWRWTGPRGAWYEVPGHDVDNPAEYDQLWREVNELWNQLGRREGVLQDHPRYEELFDKWAWRQLCKRPPPGITPRLLRKPDRNGNLFTEDGTPTGENIREVMHDWLDNLEEYVRDDLRIMEGFIDISYNASRLKELGLEDREQ